MPRIKYSDKRVKNTSINNSNKGIKGTSVNAETGFVNLTLEDDSEITLDLSSFKQEAITSMSVNATILTYTDENGDTTDIDLSLFIDDTNLSRIIAGTVDPQTGIATFSRDDSSEFTIDLSPFLSSMAGTFVLSDLQNVTSVEPTLNQVLTFDGARWTPGNLPAQPTLPTELSDFTDIDTTGATLNQVLKYNGTSWAPGTIEVGTTINSLSDVTDVNVTNPLTGSLLAWDGNNWIDQQITLENIENVSVVGASSGQVLGFNGTSWAPTTPSSINSINELSDVDASSAVLGQTLIFDGTNWVPGTASSGSSGSTLSELGDTNISNPGNGQVLTWTGSAWEAVSQSATATTTSFNADIEGNRNTVNGLLLNPNPEERLSFAPYIVNDLGFALARGGSYTTNDITNDTEIARLFDGSADFWYPNTSLMGDTEETAVWIEVDLPDNMVYGAYLGVSFGTLGFASNGVHLEAHSMGEWKTVIHTESNEKGTLMAAIPGNGSPGTDKVRLSLWNPKHTSRDVRVTHLFGYDFNSALAKTLLVSRDGGNIYGDIDMNQNDILNVGNLEMGPNNVFNIRQDQLVDSTSVLENHSHAVRAEQISAGIFSNAQHDVLAFGGHPDNVVEFHQWNVSTNTWDSADVPMQLFAQKVDQAVEMFDGDTHNKARITVTGPLAYNAARALVMGHIYTHQPADFNVKVSILRNDTGEWEVIHQSGPHVYNSITGVYTLGYWASADKVEILMEGATPGPMRLSFLKLMTSRPGAQGRGPEYQYPYTWDSEYTMKPRNGMNMREGQITNLYGNSTKPALEFGNQPDKPGLYYKEWDTISYGTSTAEVVRINRAGLHFVDSNGNPQKYWHAGNDGPGSGLNADLLDGYSSEEFMRNNTDQRVYADLRVDGDLQGDGDLIGDYGTFRKWLLNPNPEQDLAFAPYIVNDLAFMHKRGATWTSNDPSFSDTKLGYMVDGKASFYYAPGNLMGDTAATGCTFEVNLPENLYYGSYVGIAFGAKWNRARGVRIEAWVSDSTDGDRWETCIDVGDNNSDVIMKRIPNNRSPGTSKLRVTLWSPENAGGVRVTHLFAYDYNSPLATSLFLSRDGGNIYGDLEVKGRLTQNGEGMVTQSSGTFTPTVGAGTVSIANGFWSKVGNQVTVSLQIGGFSDDTTWISIGAGSLPFANRQNVSAHGTAMSKNINYGSGPNRSLTAYITPGSSVVKFMINAMDGSNWGGLSHGHLNGSVAADVVIEATITYWSHY